jgi:hypothetical protein
MGEYFALNPARLSSFLARGVITFAANFGVRFLARVGKSVEEASTLC